MAVAERALDTRTLILDAVDDLLERYGFKKMTVEDVADEAGISRRTIYLHFPSKEELGLSSIDRVVEQAQHEMRQAADGPGPVAHRLQRTLCARVLARVDRVRRYRQSLDGLFEAVRPAYMDRRKRHFEVETLIIETLVEEGAEGGEFVTSDPKATAISLLRATNAFLPYSLSVAELAERGPIEDGVSAMAQLLIRGLASSSSISFIQPENHI